MLRRFIKWIRLLPLYTNKAETKKVVEKWEDFKRWAKEKGVKWNT